VPRTLNIFLCSLAALCRLVESYLANARDEFVRAQDQFDSDPVADRPLLVAASALPDIRYSFVPGMFPTMPPPKPRTRKEWRPKDTLAVSQV
jgi:hypothetical protein